MIEDDDKDEMIEQYLLGQTSEGSRSQFEERLAADDQLKKEVAVQKAIIQNVRAAGRQKWASKLESIHSEMEHGESKDEEVLQQNNKVKPITGFYRNRYLMGIAAMLIVVVTSALLLTLNNTPDGGRIFVSYYKPYPSLEQNTRSLPVIKPTEKEQAFEAYENSDYIESIRLFKIILTKGEDEEVLFYLANAYLAADNAKKAENTYKEYLQKYSEFAPEARWYLSLSYMKDGKITDAKKILLELAKNNKEYSKEAKEVLAKLQ